MKKENDSYSGTFSASKLEIFLNIDHLTSGKYTVHFVVKNRVIKTIRIQKK